MTFWGLRAGLRCKKPAQGGYILSGPLCDFKERFLPETPGTDFLYGGSSVLLRPDKTAFWTSSQLIFDGGVKNFQYFFTPFT